MTEVEAGFTADGELVALRYDAIEDVGAYVRAPEPATLYRMHGSLSGAYRVRERRGAEPRRAHEHDPVRAQPRLRRAAALLRARADDGDRRAAARARPGRARAAQPRARRRDAVPDAVGGALRLGRLRGVSRPRARARAATTSSRARVGAARAEGRLAGVGLACVVEPSISNMGYITLAQTAVERAPALPKSGNAEGASSRSTRTAGSPYGSRRRRRVRATARCAPRSSPTSSAAPPRTSPCSSEIDTATTPWTVASGNYSSRFSGVGVGAVQAAARKLRTKIDAIREHAGDPELALRRSRGWRTGTPKGCRTAWSRAWPRSPSGRRRTSIRPTPRIASHRRPRTGSSSTSARSRSTARRAR